MATIAPMYGYGNNPGSNQFASSNMMPNFYTPGNSPGYGSGGGSGTPGFIPYNAWQSPMESNNPYQVPSQSGYAAPSDWGASGGPLMQGQSGGPGASHNLGHGIIATGPQYPGLSQSFANYISSQIGQGASPFNLQTMLPTGGSTMPGQLTAGLNPLLSQLMNFFQTGQGGSLPGMSQLSTIANNGVSALPEWQSMINAQQQNIQQNQANLKEQFGSMGDLAGSPFGTAMSNYMSQTTADQNALLGQLQQSNIQNIQMPAIQSLFGGSQAMAGGLQGLDQQAIQNMYQEFQRVSPQNNPLMQEMMGLATLFPPTTKTPTMMDSITGMLGALSGSGFSTSSGGGMTF